MIGIAMWCGRCGSFEVPASYFTVFFAAEADGFAWRVLCSFCADAVCRSVIDGVGRILLGLGMPHELEVNGPKRGRGSRVLQGARS